MPQHPTRLFDFPLYQLENKPLDNALVNKINGKWTPVSTQEYVDKSQQFGRALIENGIQAGDKIAIVSTTNRWEWNICDIGTMMAGAVDVPVYPTIGEEDYEYIFNHAEVKMCFVSDKELYEKVDAIIDKVDSLEKIYIFDEEKGIENWQEFLKKGDDKKHQDELQKRMDAAQTEDLATIIYTSGTTGKPKGVMLSHRNIASNSLDSQDRIPTFKGAKALSFLPLCHVYERMLIYLYQYNSIPIFYAESIDTIGDNLREVKPEIFTAVPRLLEKVFDKIIAKGKDLSGIKKGLFFWAVGLAEDYKLEGRSAWYDFKLKIARKLIFSKWQEALGGEVQAVCSGSAALNPRIARIFLAAGINVQEGYGLTETSPVISVNGPSDEGKKIGAVGRPINNVEVKIDEDGEILCKGPNVMLGYYKDEGQTKEVIDDDGWLHTGDIGEIDGDGFLKITDRKKEIFKTSGGKYIAPTPMETKFKESSFIEQIMVIGEGEKHPAAFIQPDFEFLKSWAEKKGISYSDKKELVQNEKVVERFQEEVDEHNKSFGQWEKIKKFELVPKEWTVDDEELTPTMKLKRRVVLEKNMDLYAKIYGHKKGE